MTNYQSLVNDIQEILISEKELQQKIRNLGQEISSDYSSNPPLLIGVLKGCLMVISDLMKNITLPVTVDFLAISSYGPTTKPSGAVRILKDLDLSIEGKDILIVEDIIDTGLTLNYILKMLKNRNPASIQIATLLDKPARRIIDLPIKYRGFEIPDRFVVGYGLDYAEKYRNLPFIGILKSSIYSQTNE